MKIPFVGPTYTSRSRDVNYQICRNFYLESDPSGKNLIALYPTPGLNVAASVDTGPCRGNGIIFQGFAYFVLNNMLYRFDGASLTAIGTLNTISGRVQMAENGDQLVVVDESDGWIYDGSTFSQISDGDFPDCSHVRFMDSYFIVNKINSRDFYISALNDGTSWAALDFASASRSPDNLVAIEVAYRELWLFKRDTTEVWYNSGATDFPFAPIQNGFIEWGCAAAHSPAKLDNNLVWLANTTSGGPVVVMTSGYSPQVISTSAMNTEFTGYATISDAFSQVYRKAGHEFYELTFPTANKTWLFDSLTRQWFEMTSGNDCHRTTGVVYINNKHYAGDRQTGNIYEVDFETYNEILVTPATASLTRSGGTVTATVTGHAFTAADRVTIKGANQSEYNGTFDIKNVTANTFDYLISGTPTTPATGSIMASLEKPIIRTRSSPHIHKGQKRLTHHKLQIDFEMGVGVTYGQGQDPTASLRWSDDGGFTYGNTHTVSLGKIGQYGARAVWYRLGSSFDRVYELTVSDPVKVVVIGAELTMTENDS